MIRTLALIAALAGISISTSGCALAVAGMAGYLIANDKAKTEKVEACRANLKTVNADRIAHGKDAFPDTCG